ncbi:hypothetical protein, partial [Klebsiella aerogenes]|uniref:hypothetical protein n=1 Tax=Klebsiella aerogenes TaxID=548 RepID=UPI0013D5B8F6
PRTVAQTFTPGQCTGTSRPDVRLDLRDPEVHLQPGVSVATLTAQQRTITDYQNQPNSTNGVTRYRVTASYDAQLRMMLANGACIAPTLIR